MSTRRILIIGGSTRAAADSVRRAGWQPICADLFADLDLRKTAQVIPVRSYPKSLPDDVSRIDADGWFFCGALENHPEILEQVEELGDRVGPLLGTPSQTLRLVRDPVWVAETLKLAGIAHLDVAGQSSPPASDGNWIQKPLASAGGRLIRVWDQTAADVPFPDAHYFQRRAAGTAMSAIFAVNQARADFLFASSEIPANTASAPPTGFAYCGSIGPVVIDPMIHSQLKDIIEAVVNRASSLHGLVGVDFRLDAGHAWLTEINPRYTASVEVAELATGSSFLNPSISVVDATDVIPGTRFVAKQILYATKRFVAPDLRRLITETNVWQVPIIADVPVPATVIDAGWPICTVLADGDSELQVRETLESRLELVKRLLREE